jgi:hypothetical protein
MPLYSSVNTLVTFIKKNYDRLCEDEICIKLIIDNIESIFFLSIEPDDKKKYSFYIDSRYLDFCIYDTEKFDDLNKCCSKIEDIINNYKFCRFNNKLVPKEQIDYYSEMIDTFSKINEDSIQEYSCPICLENEGTMVLKCFHKICYLCRIKIIKSDIKAKCPMCKSSCIFDTSNDLFDETITMSAEFQIRSSAEYDEEDDSDDEDGEDDDGEDDDEEVKEEVCDEVKENVEDSTKENDEEN